jgi:DNA-binding FrmR family transcriptional regulator
MVLRLAFLPVIRAAVRSPPKSGTIRLIIVLDWLNASQARERTLDGEADCEQVMHLIAGVRGAMAGLMAEVVEDHVRTHLVDAEKRPTPLIAEAAKQLLDMVRPCLK